MCSFIQCTFYIIYKIYILTIIHLKNCKTTLNLYNFFKCNFLSLHYQRYYNGNEPKTTIIIAKIQWIIENALNTF